MSRPLRVAHRPCPACPADHNEHRPNWQPYPAAAQGDRERFVGAWRLAWWRNQVQTERSIRRTDRKGSLIFTRDGRMCGADPVPRVAVVRLQ